VFQGIPNRPAIIDLTNSVVLTSVRLVPDSPDAGISEEHQEDDTKEEEANGQNVMPVLFVSLL
jgi:hypothetical protein